MTATEAIEGMMLVCFSMGWYWSIAKMLQVKTASGKSLTFVVLICSGYALGVGSKLAAWHSGGDLSFLVYVYGWNFLVILFDAVLVRRYSRPRRRAHDRVYGLDQVRRAA